MSGRQLMGVLAIVGLLGGALLLGPVSRAAEDPLPSWRDGPVKQGLLDFVRRVTTQGGPDYVPPAERVATFDNDGTLWSEKPIYFQLQFALDRVRALAAAHPEWKGQTALPGRARERPGGAREGGDGGAGRADRRHPCGHDRDRVRRDREGLARHGEAPAVRLSLPGSHLRAHAGAPRPPAGERLPGVDLLRRRHRLHARVRARGLRGPAGAGHRQHGQEPLRAARGAAGDREGSGDRERERQGDEAGRDQPARGPASRPGGGELGRRPRDAPVHRRRRGTRADAPGPPRRRRARVGLRQGLPRGPAGARRWPRPGRAGGRSSR